MTLPAPPIQDGIEAIVSRAINNSSGDQHQSPLVSYWRKTSAISRGLGATVSSVIITPLCNNKNNNNSQWTTIFQSPIKTHLWNRYTCIITLVSSLSTTESSRGDHSSWQDHLMTTSEGRYNLCTSACTGSPDRASLSHKPEYQTRFFNSNFGMTQLIKISN